MGNIDKGRREFFAAFLRVGAETPKKIAGLKKKVAAPFGSGGYRRLEDLCISCGKCVEACRYGVLKMAVAEYGIGSIMRPVMDFDTGFCDYECTACMEVCPTGALENIGADAKQSVSIGIAEVEIKRCINFSNEGRPCSVCSEKCPASAIKLICGRPVVEPELCIGCGACEFFCKASPVKAIRIEGYEIHK